MGNRFDFPFVHFIHKFFPEPVKMLEPATMNILPFCAILTADRQKRRMFYVSAYSNNR